ncbi:DUF1002 domain-containing protein, partial [Romboutsia sp.]|uniref:DUF1002 domain-containing protein n=1 Tax=Romboutsia sp. TaxID=1965302 RepID=UPI002C7363D3
TGLINDIKTEIIKKGTTNPTQIAETINNITNNYNITLSDEQLKQIEDLMLKIAQQDYDYDKIKDTLGNVSNNIDKNLNALGESVNNSGIFDSIKGWFGNLFGGDKNLGILESTNDNLLGENAQINATDDKAVNLPSSEEVEGFFDKILNWFTGLFSSNKIDTNQDQSLESSQDGDATSEIPQAQ